MANPLPVGKWIQGSVRRTASGKIQVRTSNPTVRRNVEMGFYDAGGAFHPIRASADYSASRAGESKDWRRDTKRKKKSSAAAKPARGKKKAVKKKKTAAKRKPVKRTARRPAKKTARRRR